MYIETALSPNPSSLPAAPLRRTLSADMSSSSQKWLQIKRARSTDRLDAFDHHDQKLDDHDEIKLSHNNGDEKRGAFDEIWGSILSNKKSEPGSGSDAPYVHPLVKRTSSLSDKSLGICTENLGSETGSDGFGSEDNTYLHDPIANFNDNNIVENETAKEINCKRASPTHPAKTVTSLSSFPPPLPSLSHRMRSHRHGGRLVVEAVSVATTTCLQALRRDGRLLLTLSSDDVADHDYNVDRDDERKELSIEFVMEEKASCRMIMSKVIGGEWRRPRKVNATVIKDLDDEDENTPATEIQWVNAYEYYWRRSHVSNRFPSQVVVLGRSMNKISAQAQTQAQEEKVKVKEAVENLVPFLRGCKEPRRSLLCWEPHCIATS